MEPPNILNKGEERRLTPLNHQDRDDMRTTNVIHKVKNGHFRNFYKNLNFDHVLEKNQGSKGSPGRAERRAKKSTNALK